MPYHAQHRLHHIPVVMNAEVIAIHDNTVCITSFNVTNEHRSDANRLHHHLRYFSGLLTHKWYGSATAPYPWLLCRKEHRSDANRRQHRLHYFPVGMNAEVMQIDYSTYSHYFSSVRMNEHGCLRIWWSGSDANCPTFNSFAVLFPFKCDKRCWLW